MRLSLPGPLRILLHPQYGPFAIGTGISLIGTWMQRIGASWLVWEWTHSAFWVGALAAADLLPVVVIGPFAGVAADRWDRLRQNRMAQQASAVLALVLAGLYLSGWLNLTLLLVCIGLQGALIAAVQPARLAMVQQMVPREDMGIAVALNSINVNLARLIGPAAAGLLIVHAGMVWVFLLNAVATVLFVLILKRVRLSPREEVTQHDRFLAQMKIGFAHVLTVPDIRTIMAVLFLGGVLVRSVIELVPAIAAETFEDAALGLAVLTASAAVGAILSGLTVGSGETQRLQLTVVLWWALGAAAACLLIRAPNTVVAVLATVVVGASITRGLVGTQTYVQLTTPDRLRGRVLGVHGLIARGSPAIGALGVGYAADRIGLDSAVTAAAVAMLFGMGALLLRQFGGTGG